MMKWIASFVLAALCLTACNRPLEEHRFSGGQASKTVTYSNLMDEASQNSVAQVLQRQGVPQERIHTWLEWVEDLNGRITSPQLPVGFVEMAQDYVDYSQVRFPLKEGKGGTYMPEPNCRLTAFLLLGDRVSARGERDENDWHLLFDLQAIDNYQAFAMSPQDKAHYSILFQWVPVAGAATMEEHTQLIQQAWRSRDIALQGSGLSLVTVYAHSVFEDVRFVTHAGVLAETEEGLLFVERYSPEAPFQATRFQNRAQLKEYLLARPDLYGEKKELPPIVMENGEPLAA